MPAPIPESKQYISLQIDDYEKQLISLVHQYKRLGRVFHGNRIVQQSRPDDTASLQVDMQLVVVRIDLDKFGRRHGC